MAEPRAENGSIDAPVWLTARPIAHRGLHDRARGVIENTRGAARAAIARLYAIECDVQLSGDGEAMVFHDFTLERLTAAAGRLDAATAREIAAIAYRNGAETIAPLPEFLAELQGATPLIIEIKSRFDGDHRLAARLLEILSGYDGPAAVKSFDPDVLAFLRRRDFRRPLGLVAQARYDEAGWPELDPGQRVALAALTGFSRVRPDFLSWHVGDLPHATPQLCRAGIGMPVMTWTVRSEADRRRAADWADQMIFEGFAP
jgi:glycerophosphoryl diester phosphodiesterase